MQSSTAAAALRLTGTLVSQYFRFGCDRQLRWQMVPRGLRGTDVPAPNADPSAGPLVGVRPGMGLLTQAGRRFERKALDALVRYYGEGRVLTAGRDERGDAARLPYDAVVRALRDPGETLWLVQPELRVPDPAAFAARFGIDPDVQVAPAHPDLVRIGRDRGGRPMFGVADVKWSREATVQHYAQVAFYTVLLEEICRAEGIEGAVETRWGWLWTRGSRGPKRFPLAAYRHHVQELLRQELPRIAAAAPGEAEWHLRPRCTSCAFFHHCRAEADRTDDLSRVVGMTPLARRELRARGIRSVRDLRKAEFRRGVYEGCHALESAETTLKKRVQALDFGKIKEGEKQSFRMGGGESVRVLISAEGDPVSGTLFALGLRVERSSGRSVSEVFLSTEGSEQGEREMLGRFLFRAGHLVAAAEEVARAAGDGRRGEKPVHVFVWDRGEVQLLRDCLQRHLGDPGTQPGIAGIARLLFPGGDSGGTPPGTVVLDVVSELFALPVPYAWDLAAVSAELQPSEAAAVHAPRGDYGWPLSSQVAYERIHNVWSDRPYRANGVVQAPDEVRAELERTVQSKLAAMDSVIRAIREAAARRRDPVLRMASAYAAAADRSGGPIPHAALEKLRLFTLAEAAEEAVAIRQLHALPTADRARRFECISGLNKVEILPNGHAVFEFDEGCREAKFRPGDFTLLLTNDDGRTLGETDTKPWLRRKLMVELIDYDLAASPPRVTLASDHSWESLEKARLEGRPLLDLDRVCVLDRASVDFTTARVVATLRALAAGAGEADFVLGVLGGAVPDGWRRPLDADHAWRDTVAAAGERLRDVQFSPSPGVGGGGRGKRAPADAVRSLPRSILNAEQAEAWRAAFDRAVSVVWGPPGTGKTYLLAWQLIGLAAAARREGRALRILVSAATHRAIVNVLVRIAGELREAGIPSPLRAFKLAGRGSEADADLAGLDVEVIRDPQLAEVLAASDADGTPVVVGSTVWSLWKQMRAMNGASEDEDADAASPVRPLFDVVVIDEASQMKVPDALIALSSIRRGGRVILAGDDRQLPPILHGRYPREDTLLGSAFAHFAERFGRFQLRESRRMNRALVRWPRRLFYPRFVSMDPARRLLLSPEAVDLSDPVDALLWDAFLRPEDAVVFCTYEGVRATARNAVEASLVARIARLARAGMVDPATGERYTAEAFRSHGLAVISPHRAQNSAILGELVAGGWPREELPVVDTVERMQGNERELVLVSYAVADREYAEREAEFLLNPNRFNVSITRPRSKLIVFLSEDILRTIPQDEEVMTESTAIKGYPSHFPDPPREIDYPAPGGKPVRLRVRTRRV
ncbi:MAG TPA: AAA domain-containing protein [Longimicrobium sp.]|nr:AAA domain-containing protein [Longimicrobium sp.]